MQYVCLQFNLSMTFSSVSLQGNRSNNLSRIHLLNIIPVGGASDCQLAEILLQETEKE